MNTLQQVIKQRQDEFNEKFGKLIKKIDSYYGDGSELNLHSSLLSHNQETVVAILEAVKEWAEKQDGFELGEKVFFNQISRIDLLFLLSSTLQEIKNQK